MSSTELLEGVRIVGAIVLVWFGLIGWKLVPLCRRRAATWE